MKKQKVRHMMSFEMYPEQAVQLMMDTAVGKPFKDTDGNVIGEIISVKRTENPKVLEFISEVHLEEVNGIEGKSASVVSIDERRED